MEMSNVDGQSNSARRVPAGSETVPAPGNSDKESEMSASKWKHSQQENMTIKMEETSQQASVTIQSGSTQHKTAALVAEGLPLSREVLSEQMQCLIDQINEKRKRDTSFMDAFRKAMHQRVEMACSALEERMYKIYDITGKEMQPKIQELFATLDRVASMEEEQERFKEGLGAFYKQLHGSKP